MNMNLLSVREAAERLGISAGTLYNWISDRRLSYVKVGRRSLIDPRVLEKFIENNTIPEKGPLVDLRDVLGRRKINKNSGNRLISDNSGKDNKNC